MRDSGSRLKRAAAHAAVLLLLSGALLAVSVGRLARRAWPRARGPRDSGELRVLLVGTFYNTGWLQSHAVPVSRCRRVREVRIVCDAALATVDKVVYSCPPTWVSRLFSRAPARFLWLLRAAWSGDCDVLIGYHIMPNALMCLVAATWLGRKSVYQMTGGPAQLVGGGAASENVLLRHLGRESKLLQSLLFRLVRRFDAVIVRGTRALEFVRQWRLAEKARIITGSVDLSRFVPGPEPRPYDVIYVGRLVPAKGCDLLQEILVEVVRRRPTARVVVAGDGPLRGMLEGALARAGVAGNVALLGRRDDVAELLAQSKVFVLASPDEGLSIALLEAMASAVVPVVPDVGELSDVVSDGEAGFLVLGRDPRDFADRIVSLLADEEFRKRLGAHASIRARACAGTETVTSRWDALFDELFPRAKTVPPAEAGLFSPL